MLNLYLLKLYKLLLIFGDKYTVSKGNLIIIRYYKLKSIETNCFSYI